MTGFDYAVIGIVALYLALGLWRGVVSVDRAGRLGAGFHGGAGIRYPERTVPVCRDRRSGDPRPVRFRHLTSQCGIGAPFSVWKKSRGHLGNRFRVTCEPATKIYEFEIAAGLGPFQKLRKFRVNHRFPLQRDAARVWWGPGTGVTHIRVLAAAHSGQAHIHEGMGTGMTRVRELLTLFGSVAMRS
jgi:hypothetical protein